MSRAPWGPFNLSVPTGEGTFFSLPERAEREKTRSKELQKGVICHAMHFVRGNEERRLPETIKKHYKVMTNRVVVGNNCACFQ